MANFQTYWSEFNVLADTNSFGQFELDIEKLMDATGDEWHEVYGQEFPFSSNTIDNNFVYGKIDLPIDNKWMTLKIITTSGLILYYKRDDIDLIGFEISDKTIATFTYKLLWNETLFKKIKIEMEQLMEPTNNDTPITLPTYFNHINKNRWELNDEGEIAISLQDMWWLRKTLPIDINLENTTVEEIDYDTFSTYQNNKIKDTYTFIPVEGAKHNVIGDNFHIFFHATEVINDEAYDFQLSTISSEVDYEQSAPYNCWSAAGLTFYMQKDSYWAYIFVTEGNKWDCFLNYTWNDFFMITNFNYDTSPNSKSTFNPLDFEPNQTWSGFDSNNMGCWKILGKLKQLTTPQSTLYEDEIFMLQDDDKRKWNNYTDPQKDEKSGLFNIRYYRENVQNENVNLGAIVFIGTHDDAKEYGLKDGEYIRVELKWNYSIPDTGSWTQTQNHQKLPSGFYILGRNTGTTINEVNKHYHIKVEVIKEDYITTNNVERENLFPFNLNVNSTEGRLDIATEQFASENFLNKHRFIIVQDTSINQNTTDEEGLIKGNIGPSQATFLVIPILNTIDYSKDKLPPPDPDILVPNPIILQDYWEALFNPYNKSSPDSTYYPELILNNDNIVSCIETTLPITWLFKFPLKYYFKNYIGEEGSEKPEKLIPIFTFAIPAVEWENSSSLKQITLYQKTNMIDFDFSTWEWKNEPMSLSPQFFLVELNSTTNEAFHIPVECFSFFEHQIHWTFDFNITITDSLNLIMDTKYLNEKFSTNMFLDNFIFTLSTPFSIQTTSWNNWIQNHYNDEMIARQNYEDRVKIENMNYGKNVANTVVSDTVGGLSNIAKGIAKGSEMGPIGAITGGIAEGAKSIAGAGLDAYNLGIQRKTLDMQIAMGQRNLDNGFRQIRLSPSSLRKSQFQATNIQAKSGYSFNITTPFDDQITQIMNYLYYNGYPYGAMDNYLKYKNRIYYNPLNIDITKNYQEWYNIVSKILENPNIYPELKQFNSEKYILAFLDWISKSHGFYGHVKDKNSYNFELNFKTNIELEWENFEVDGWDGNKRVSYPNTWFVNLYNPPMQNTREYKIFWDGEPPLNPNIVINHNLPTDDLIITTQLDELILKIDWTPTKAYEKSYFIEANFIYTSEQTKRVITKTIKIEYSCLNSVSSYVVDTNSTLWTKEQTIAFPSFINSPYIGLETDECFPYCT